MQEHNWKNWHDRAALYSRPTGMLSRRRGAPEQLDVFGCEAVCLVDDCGEPALKLGGFGLAGLHRRGLLGVAGAQGAQPIGTERAGAFGPALAYFLDERGFIERGEGFELLAGLVDVELGAQPVERVAAGLLIGLCDGDQPLNCRLDLGALSSVGGAMGIVSTNE